MPDQSGHDHGSAKPDVADHDWERDDGSRTTIRNCTTPCGRASSARARRRRADHPARHAARADRQRRGRRRRSSTASISGSPTRISRHRQRQGRRSSAIADHIASFGLKVGSFVAPIWGGAGGGSAMGRRRRPQALPHPGEEGLRHRPADARARHPPDRRRPHRLLDRRRGLGQGPGGQHQADRRDLPRGRQDRRRTMASSSSPRARSAGAACSPGART